MTACYGRRSLHRCGWRTPPGHSHSSSVRDPGQVGPLAAELGGHRVAAKELPDDLLGCVGVPQSRGPYSSGLLAPQAGRGHHTPPQKPFRAAGAAFQRAASSHAQGIASSRFHPSMRMTHARALVKQKSTPKSSTSRQMFRPRARCLPRHRIWRLRGARGLLAERALAR